MIRQAIQILEKSLDNNCSSNITSYFNWLASNAPIFSVFGSQVKVLQEPGEFYNAIIEKCQTAKKRIMLTSLYLGNGRLSQNLVKQLSNRLSEIKDLDVNILLDANRGSRGHKNSRKMLLPLLKNYPSCHVSMYHTPNLRGPLRFLLPQRYNELVGLQHMKIYLFDDSVIISGANLSEDYFTNRQDRYVMVSDCKDLADFYWGLVNRVKNISFALDSSNNLVPRTVDPIKTRKELFVSTARNSIWNYCLEAINTKRFSHPEHDTWLFPVVEFPPFGIHQDSVATLKLLNSTPAGCRVTLSTGYFNLTDDYVDSIVNTSLAQFRILMAHPSANGFENARGPAGGIPHAYTALAAKFLEVCQYPRISLLEYQRDGWTYHVKGLWLTPARSQGPLFTIIGSSNFGVRSVTRDLESSLGILTVNPSLRRALRGEEESYLSYTTWFNSDSLRLPSRITPLWVRATILFFKSFF